MNEIINLALTNEEMLGYLKNINEKSPIKLLGLTDFAKNYFVELTKKQTDKQILIITYNEIQAKRLIDDFKIFDLEGVYYFPKKEIVTYDYLAESKDSAYDRIDTLNSIVNGKAKIIVATIESVMQNIVPKKVLYKNIIELEVGKTYYLDKLKQDLINLGYERYDLIEARGQISIRGDIVDIGISNDIGIRVEFWGDEVDSIRYFNISSQRSIEEIKRIKIYPCHEYILEKSIDTVVNAIKENYEMKPYYEFVETDIEQIKNGNFISKMDKYFNEFYSEKSNLMDYLKKDSMVFIDEENRVESRIDTINKDNNLVMQNLNDKKRKIPDILLEIPTKEEIINKINKNQIIYLEKIDATSKNINKYHFKFREINLSRSGINTLIEEVQTGLKLHKNIVVFGGNEETSKKIANLINENNVDAKYCAKIAYLDINQIIVTKGEISAGFECKELNLLLIDASKLLKQESSKRKKLPSVFKQGEKVIFSDLKVGDYVVHKTNGIGQFIGVSTIEADGVIKDYIKIKYRDDGILYIPTNVLDNIRKYIGVGESEPTLSKLGSKEWINTKTKVKKNLREVARNLIELYAKRQKGKGFAFSKDTPWQKQFEDSFPYTETDDQLRCIEEVKKDMELEKPMDRLLCGDVGYGKTEVAIRAAFKACMDQKQVAYLVPTTVLANQQYESFKSRMQGFAINVELLNRFKTKKQQDEIIRKLKLGEVDVVIGTHRILSKDIEFKDLGLLIIDEEHRFGVKAKEKIKEIKNTVDVLTMTATPIPRTLHMSIVGVRDMSVIYEPPQNRKPVQTYVLPYDEDVVKEAITKELERNGQVFYLYNNVENIMQKAEQIEMLVPEGKVGYAHGKMTGRELENIMMDFVEGKINILVCTTILESGIDIPNANTIIVENADRLGLAQLYQIRGRVGRSDIQSYAYITYKQNKLLSEVADKRLKAMKEFTEFGSGFKIAMRDLEIRGAGSLVGEIQHGHMEEVGYETYCRLLEEVIAELQGTEIKEEIDVQIDLNVSSYIPDSYIQVGSQKIEVYQNIALCKTEEDIFSIIDEIIDRFGNMPSEVENLIEIARIKNLCRKKDILKVQQKGKKILFYFNSNTFDIDKLINKYKNRIKFSEGINPYITLELSDTKTKTIFKEVKEFINI